MIKIHGNEQKNGQYGKHFCYLLKNINYSIKIIQFLKYTAAKNILY